MAYLQMQIVELPTESHKFSLAPFSLFLHGEHGERAGLKSGHRWTLQ